MENIHKFAKSMLSRSSGFSAVQTGCTYIGQMISHDIVPPTSPKIKLRESLSWALNLNSLYDNINEDPNSDCYGMFDYVTVCSTRHNTPGYDFLRDYSHDKKYEIANITEKRNDENAIISQLHIFWLRLHNKLRSKYGIDKEEARKWTTLAFQLVVVHDFLHQTLSEDVFKKYFTSNETCLDKSLLHENGMDVVPSFFSLASFRFGHTMVRKSYEIREGVVQDLSRLFSRNRVLSPNNAIDWKLFFNINNTKPIDTFITKNMGKVPKDRETGSHIIPLLNLEASQCLYANVFIDKLLNNPDTTNFLTDLKFSKLIDDDLKGAAFHSVEKDINNLTLWPYILLEAQKETDGRKLGVLGSVLNAEVIKVAMQNAKYSVYEGSTNNDEYKLSKVLDNMGDFGSFIRNSLLKENLLPENFDGEKQFKLMHTIIEFNS